MYKLLMSLLRVKIDDIWEIYNRDHFDVNVYGD